MPIGDDVRLGRPVNDRADVLALSDDEHRLLARWLAEAGALTEIPPAARRRRRALLSATAAAVALAPWTVYLAATLPDRQRAGDWRLAWVGFDAALMLASASAAWFGWRSRQLVITACLVTAMLLFCDAWFDVVLSWGSPEQATAIVTAIAAEVPFAVFLLSVYHRLVQALTTQVWRDRGRAGDPPPLRQLPLFLQPTMGEPIAGKS